MKKIVIVNQSSNYLMSDIARAYKECSQYEDVVVMCGNPQSLQLTGEEQIKIEKIKPYDKKSIITRFLSWVIGTIQIAHKVRTRYHDYELLLVSNPPTIQFLSYLSSNKYSTLVYDVYPDGIVSGGFVTEKNLIFKLWVHVAKKFYKGADYIYAISDGIAKKVSRYCNLERIEVIPLWSNKQIRRVEKAENLFVRKYGLEDKFIVLYSGNIGKGSNIKVLVDLARAMKANARVQFVVIGEGMEKPFVEDAIKRDGLNNILLLPYQPLEILSHSLSSADLAYVSVEPKAANVCIPSKTFNLLNVETPFICIASKNAEITRLINSCEIERVFDTNEIGKMVVFVNEMLNNRSISEKYRRNIQSIKDEYSFLNAKKFVKV